MLSFSRELSWMRSGTEMSQFLNVSYLLLVLSAWCLIIHGSTDGILVVLFDTLGLTP